VAEVVPIPKALIICAPRLAAESRGMRLTKITFGEMRACGGPTGILVYCADYRCSHSIEMPGICSRMTSGCPTSSRVHLQGLRQARRRRTAALRARPGWHGSTRLVGNHSNAIDELTPNERKRLNGSYVSSWTDRLWEKVAS
jgi:hypothetical protein